MAQHSSSQIVLYPSHRQDQSSALVPHSGQNPPYPPHSQIFSTQQQQSQLAVQQNSIQNQQLLRQQQEQFQMQQYQTTQQATSRLQQQQQQQQQQYPPLSVNPNDHLNNQMYTDQQQQQLLSQSSSQNLQFNAQAQQMYQVELRCLQKCNEWLAKENAMNTITKEPLRFQTMLELEIFVEQIRREKSSTYSSSFKWGSIAGAIAATLFFYHNSEKSFTGFEVFRTFGLSSILSGSCCFLLSKQNSIGNLVARPSVSFNFEAFSLFFDSCILDVYAVRKRLLANRQVN